MQIRLRGNPIKSVHMPPWNPGQILDVEVDSASARAPVRLPIRPLFDPCRIECLLNPTILGGDSNNSRVRGMIKAEDQVEALLSIDDDQAASNGTPPYQLSPTNLNRMEISIGNRRPIYPTGIISDTATDSAEAYPKPWASGNLMQYSRSEGKSLGDQNRHDHLFCRTDDSNWHHAVKDTKAAVSLMALDSDTSRNHKGRRVGRNVSFNGVRSQYRGSLNTSVSVSLWISKAWKNSAACRWLPSRGHLKTFAGGSVYLIEVHLAGSQEPVHLKRWRRGEWRGHLCNSSSLTISHDKVLRLTSKGGWGQGILLRLNRLFWRFHSESLSFLCCKQSVPQEHDAGRGCKAAQAAMAQAAQMTPSRPPAVVPKGRNPILPCRVLRPGSARE